MYFPFNFQIISDLNKVDKTNCPPYIFIVATIGYV